MKKLILLLLLLSSCDQAYTTAKAEDPPVIVCATKTEDYYWYRLSSSIDRSAIKEQIKITLNDDVMLDTCQARSADGFTLYPSTTIVYLELDLKKNELWLDEYFDESGEPMKSEVDVKIETTARCEDPWEEAVAKTQTAVSWWNTAGGCTPPGYYGQFSVPLGN